MNSHIDISSILSTVRTPTLVMHHTQDAMIDVGGGRDLASEIPGAPVIEYPGVDHLPFVGEDVDETFSEIAHFLSDHPPLALVEQTLANIMVAKFGPSVAHGRNGALDYLIHSLLAPSRGREMAAGEDRLVAIFDGPARALECGLSIAAEFQRLGQSVRIGVHTGDVSIADAKVMGTALDIADTVAGRAGANDVLASRTVKDLVAGASIGFHAAGEFEVPGAFERWSLFRVSAMRETAIGAQRASPQVG